MANLPRDMAEEVGKSRTAGGGNFLQHGAYVLMIRKWFYQKTQDRCIIVESLVGEAHKKPVYEGTKLVEQDPNAPGSDVSEVANFDGAGKLSAPSMSRAVVLGLFGFTENEVPDAKVTETLDHCVGDSQPAAGMLIGCSTYPKEVRSRKGEFITGRNWSCVNKPGEGLNTPDMVKARLDALKISPDACVKLITEQLAAARANGSVAVPAVAPAAPPAPGMVATPTPPAPPASTSAAPPPPAVDPLAGWTANPNDPNWYYRMINGAAEQKLKTDLMAGK